LAQFDQVFILFLLKSLLRTANYFVHGFDSLSNA